MQIHISRDGKQFGPYPLEAVQRYLQSGQLVLTDLAWYEGATDWTPLSEVPGVQIPAESPPLPSPPVPAVGAHSYSQPQVLYHHVAAVKFVIFSIVSFGIYHVYWFYKNWKHVQARDRSGIRPFWRGIFCLIWCWPLVRDIRAHGGALSPGWAGILPLLYIALNLTVRLPDPYWLLSLLSFLPLLPVVSAIHQLNEAQGTRAPYYARCSITSIVLGLLGAGMLAFAALETLHLIPSTRVVDGDHVTRKEREFLRSAGILEEGEIILFFYSANLFSIKGEGNILTDRRVISYEEDEDHQRAVASSRFADIEDIDIDRGVEQLGETTVSISLADEEKSFQVVLSTEGDGDRKFTERLMSLWKAARPPGKKPAKDKDGPKERQLEAPGKKQANAQP